MSRYCYPGALHIHTTYSDGTGTLVEVVAAAQSAGLRWMIVTDHDTLEGRSYQGWRGEVLLIVDHEVTPDRNHLLACNVDGVVSRDQPPQAFIDEVYDRGGFGIIAHPDERVKNAFKDIYRWDDWTVDGPQRREGRVVGLELWNLMSDWAEHLNTRNSLANFLLPQLGLSGPTAATLAWWDRLNMAGRRTFGVAGVDAHAFHRRVPWGNIKVFSYLWGFGTLTNYLLLDEPLSADGERARNQVYGALVGGRSYFVNRLDGDAPAITFEASPTGRSSGSHSWQIGDSASLAGGPLLMRADVGGNAWVQLVHNGRVLAKGVGALRQSVTRTGVYRLEAYQGGRPWLYTNPIYIVE